MGINRNFVAEAEVQVRKTVEHVAVVVKHELFNAGIKSLRATLPDEIFY
jgi:hypothetical protein